VGLLPAEMSSRSRVLGGPQTGPLELGDSIKHPPHSAAFEPVAEPHDVDEPDAVPELPDIVQEDLRSAMQRERQVALRSVDVAIDDDERTVGVRGMIDVLPQRCQQGLWPPSDGPMLAKPDVQLELYPTPVGKDEVRHHAAPIGIASVTSPQKTGQQLN